MCQVSPMPFPPLPPVHLHQGYIFVPNALPSGSKVCLISPRVGVGVGVGVVHLRSSRPLGRCFFGGIIQAIDVCLGEHKFFLAPQYMIFVLKMVIITVSSLKVPIRITLIQGLANQRFPLNYTCDSNS